MSKEAYNIIAITNLFYPAGGGLETAAYGLLEYLIGQERECAVFFSADQNIRDKSWGMTRFGFKTFKLFHGFYPVVGIRYIFNLYRTLRRNSQAKVIIFGRHFTSSIVASLLCRMLGVKYLYVDTGFEHHVFSFGAANQVIALLDRAIFQHVMRGASKRIAVSETSRQFLIETFKFNRSDFEVVLNGFDEMLVRRHEQARKQPFIVFASRLVNVKNPNTVINAYINMARRHPDWLFYFIGKGNSKIDRLRHLPVNIVHVNDMLPREKFLELLGQAAIYINASFSEGLPMSVIEAMALGCIPVLSNIPHNLELAEIAGTKFNFTPKQVNQLVFQLDRAIEAHRSSLNIHSEIANRTKARLASSKVYNRYAEIIDSIN